MFEAAEQALAALESRVAALEAAGGVVVPPEDPPPVEPPTGDGPLLCLSFDHL